MNNQNFIDKYREFMTKISHHYTEQNGVEIDNFTDDEISKIGNTFVNEINTTTKLQKYLFRTSGIFNSLIGRKSWFRPSSKKN